MRSRWIRSGYAFAADGDAAPQLVAVNVSDDMTAKYNDDMTAMKKNEDGGAT
jgi:hypothetical protein